VTSFIRSWPLGVFVAVLGVLLVMAGIAAFAGLWARRRAAIVALTPTTPIGMATDGYREFEGRVEAVGGRTIAAPLTGWPCCWFRARVEKFETRRTGSNTSSGWRVVRDWSSSAPFLVRDATGVCVVDPYRAEVTPTDKSLWYGGAEEPTDRNPARVKPGESGKGWVEVAGGPNSKYRYLEERIYAGDSLLALGEYSTGRFGSGTAFANREDDEDDDEDIDTGGDPGGDEDADDPDAEADRLRQQAWEVTRATIARGSGAQPFIMTTTSQAEHIAQTALGAKAALGLGAIALALAAVLVWFRFLA
jgi:hypothetical protein